MKRSALTYCILSLFAILGLSACDVHEFPDMPERRPYELVLDFTNAIDMGFYQTIDYSRASTEASPSGTKTQTEITTTYATPSTPTASTATMATDYRTPPSWSATATLKI